jgi:regulator of RNase E activity RraB
MVMNFPNDADGDVLRSLQKKGVDLSQPRVIEFYCFASDRLVADKISKKIILPGFENEVFESKDTNDSTEIYSVYFVCSMVPNYADIVRIQNELNAKLNRFGTTCDGWGTLSSPD